MLPDTIAALAKQAGMVMYPTGVGIQEHTIWGDRNIEHFAKLIIQECAKIGELKEQGYAKYSPNSSVGWYMHQHFGIK